MTLPCSIPAVAALVVVACSSEPAPLSAAGAPAAASFDREHAAWTRLLARHVRDDRVDYAGFQRDRAELDAYLGALHAVGPDVLATWSVAERSAFWIDVYNAHIVRLVVEHYPVESIRDLGGTVIDRVWDLRLIPMPAHDPDGKGRNLSFDDVEHRILRGRVADARVHAALNCASASCPALRPEAYVGAKLEAQLEDAMQGFVNDERRNVLDRAAGRIRVSRIFDWFAGDFERDAGSVRSYVARYARGDDTGWIASARLEYLDYSWKLNDVERP